MSFRGRLSSTRSSDPIDRTRTGENRGDLVDAEVPARLVREVAERFGRLDVLVNNAGLSLAKPALEFAPKVRVVAVAPGTPEEVAAAVAWLVSDEASYVTGASFLIDGGLAQQVVERPAGQ